MRVEWSSDVNDVAMCFAALEVIAKEAPTETGRRDEIRSRVLAPAGASLNSEELAIRQGAADLLDAVIARR